MIKHNGIKIMVKVNRTLQGRELEGFDRKISGNYDALLNKVSIDRTFTSGTTNDSILNEISQINQIEEENIIFTLINGAKDNNIFFHQEASSLANNLQRQKGIVNMLAEQIINETFGARIWAKILEFPTFSNITGAFGEIDEEGFFQTHSISTLKDLFNLVFQNYSEKSMMIILKGTLNKFNLLYYPSEAHQLVSQLCNNFYSQKFVIANYFKLIKPPKFCFFWNLIQSAIPQAVQLIMILQSGKGDKTVIESAKKEMQRLQLTYKRLNEKYRKILNILNKCIDLENAQIDKKSLLYTDCLPSSQKPSDKLKISAIRKSQNDDEIQQLQKDVAQLQNEISLIKQGHRDKMVQHQNILTLKQGQKEKIWKLYQSYNNPKVKIDHTNNNNLYWKPIPIKADRQSEHIQEGFNQPFMTKQNLNSHKNITKKNIEVKNQNNDKRNIQFAMQVQQDTFEHLKDKKAQQIRQQQIKLQIQSLFKIIGAQQKIIEKNFQQNRHLLKNSTINQIKNRQNQLQVNPSIIRECFSKDFSKQRYDNWIKQQKYFQRFQKELKQKQMAAQTLTTIRDI